jgi:hypothetical protein
MAAATTDPRQWVLPSGYEEALEAYNTWVFGPSPVYKKGDENLFIHGNINNSAVRQERPIVSKAVTPTTGTLIVVHVVGVNYIIGDTDTRGIFLDNKQKVKEALQYSAQKEDKKDFVRIRAREGLSEEQIQETEKQTDEEAEIAGWTILTDLVKEVTYDPSEFFPSVQNADLNKWDVPMPAEEGKSQTGAWASKLLLLRIPETGVFVLKSHGTGIPQYQQHTQFDITVV